jgi:hypothetical protein
VILTPEIITTKLDEVNPGNFTGALKCAFGARLCFNKDDVWKLGMRLQFDEISGPIGREIKQLIDEIKTPKPDEPVSDLVKYGDFDGSKTERIAHIIFTNDGWKALDGKIGTGGFDGLFFKRDANGNITDVVINESKSFHGSINMNPNARGRLDQMSEQWINRVLDDKPEGVDVNLIKEIVDYLESAKGSADKVITSVDKKTGEMIILNFGKHTR